METPVRMPLQKTRSVSPLSVQTREEREKEREREAPVKSWGDECFIPLSVQFSLFRLINALFRVWKGTNIV